MVGIKDQSLIFGLVSRKSEEESREERTELYTSLTLSRKPSRVSGMLLITKDEANLAPPSGFLPLFWGSSWKTQDLALSANAMEVLPNRYKRLLEQQ